nr:hypothetical protein DGKKSRWO_DGKKSRWO_CDS_0090 [uncultured phage]CAI9752267.1 hypothetical protein CVNMHQAP_CVNMHQAP_CDS_0090 [uncultured phage]
MARKIGYVFVMISVAFVAWLFISFIEVNSHNLSSTSNLSSWNFFNIVYTVND